MFTVTANAGEVLAALLASPKYTAVRLCAPVVVKLVTKLALVDDSVPEPKVVAPSLKVTVPVGKGGVPPLIPTTDAKMVTL